jgi:serine/threonine protein kinase
MGLGREVKDQTSFGRYRLLGSLGEGGAGQVFRAYDTATDREVALKVPAPQVAQDATFEQRFRREAHVAARLSEPHVVPIHSYGEIDGRLYVDMCLIAGRDLGSVLAESGAMNPVRAVRIIEQVAYALDAAHSIDLVHRDIKPSNILLDSRDFVYLIDFGIAQDVNATRLTTAGAAIGTFAYMAPERLDTGQAGPSSDIYSLACVLYECLTGELPFPGQSIEQQIAGHLSKPPPRPSAVTAGVPQAFDEVIARGMAKNPGQRYRTVIALAEAAREALDREPREMPPHAVPTELAPTQQAALCQGRPRRGRHMLRRHPRAQHVAAPV